MLLEAQAYLLVLSSLTSTKRLTNTVQVVNSVDLGVKNQRLRFQIGLHDRYELGQVVVFLLANRVFEFKALAHLGCYFIDCLPNFFVDFIQIFEESLLNVRFVAHSLTFYLLDLVLKPMYFFGELVLSIRLALLLILNPVLNFTEPSQLFQLAHIDFDHFVTL